MSNVVYNVSSGNEQYCLAREGWKSIALIAYGSYWFPWYMPLLAERLANVWFLVRSIFSDWDAFPRDRMSWCGAADVAGKGQPLDF